MLCRAVSSDGVLHLLPSDKTSTKECNDSHGLRHDYFRNMLDLDSKSARAEHGGWVLFNNVKWLLHEGHCVVLAVTTPKALSDNCAAICTGAQIPLDAMSFGHFTHTRISACTPGASDGAAPLVWGPSGASVRVENEFPGRNDRPLVKPKRRTKQ